MNPNAVRVDLPGFEISAGLIAAVVAVVLTATLVISFGVIVEVRRDTPRNPFPRPLSRDRLGENLVVAGALLLAIGVAVCAVYASVDKSSRGAAELKAAALSSWPSSIGPEQTIQPWSVGTRAGDHSIRRTAGGDCTLIVTEPGNDVREIYLKCGDVFVAPEKRTGE